MAPPGPEMDVGSVAKAGVLRSGRLKNPFQLAPEVVLTL